jgi:hypothetical protein
LPEVVKKILGIPDKKIIEGGGGGVQFGPSRIKILVSIKTMQHEHMMFVIKKLKQNSMVKNFREFAT